VDRYLSCVKSAITRSKLQLLGVTALLIAAKYDEIYAPAIEDLVYICDGAYAADEILAMEINVLNVLQFEVTVCTCQRFLDYFLKLALRLMLQGKSTEEAEKINNTSQYLIELSLLDYRFIRYKPSLLGTAAVCLALHSRSCQNWEEFLDESTYSLKDIKLCMKELLDLHGRVPTLQLRSIPGKFADHGANLNIRDI